MDSRPDLLDSILGHCEKLTKKPESKESAGDFITPEKRPEHGMASSAGDGSPGSGSLADSEGATSTAAAAAAAAGSTMMMIPRCYQTFASLPGHILQELLSAVETSTFSLQNLKSLSGRKSRYIPKAALLELFVMIANISPDDKLPREFYSFQVMQEAAKQFNWQRYRPLSDVPLPVDWQRYGVYVIVYEPKFMIYHRILHSRRVSTCPRSSRVWRIRKRMCSIL